MKLVKWLPITDIWNDLSYAVGFSELVVSVDNEEFILYSEEDIRKWLDIQYREGIIDEEQLQKSFDTLYAMLIKKRKNIKSSGDH